MAAGSLGQAAKTRQLNTDTNSVGEADKTEMAIISARQRGDKAGLILALEVKMAEMVSQHLSPNFFPGWKLKLK